MAFRNSSWILLALALLTIAMPAFADKPSPADEELIRAAILDYAEGWYAGDADRMERCLHPDLAKRILKVDPKNGRRTVEHMGALQLVQGTRAGYGKHTPPEIRKAEITILDVMGNAATTKLLMHDWVDYLHLVKTGDRWQIVNVLWELTAEAKAKMAAAAQAKPQN